jgi:2-polyprenyl-6-hydroxyphenyl methylase/3-demethylubiquinone-9 3-methyltransferase
LRANSLSLAEQGIFFIRTGNSFAETGNFNTLIGFMGTIYWNACPLPRRRLGEIAGAPAQNGAYTYRPGCVAATARQAAMPARHEDDMAEPIDATVDAAQVERFSLLAGEWWEPHGKMAVLHKFNPVRLAYIRDAACRRFGLDARRTACLDAVRILDIGCGGGILCEPLARLGAAMTGADPSPANIEAARRHAADGGLAIDYRATTAEALADAGERFDMVLAMEVVEHVADVRLFVRRCAEMVKPDGLMIAATLNRTLKSFAFAIIGAEYVLGWLPRGTHQWDRFVTPNELEIALEQAGLRLSGQTGVIYNVLADRWQLSSDMDVNYMVTAEKAC